MSILKPELLSVPHGIGEAAHAAPTVPVATGADTDLIARIANSLYRGGGDALPGTGVSALAAAALALPEGAASGNLPHGALSGAPAGNPVGAPAAPAAAASLGGVPVSADDVLLVPAAVGGVPAVPGVPSASSAAPAAPAGAGQGDSVALAGGFPATTSSNSVPPVHPSVVDAEPESQSRPAEQTEPLRPGESVPSGTLRKGDGAHEFGEPYFYADPAGQRNGASRSGAASSHRTDYSQPTAADTYAALFGAPAGASAVSGLGGGALPSGSRPSAPEAGLASEGAEAADYYFVRQGSGVQAPSSGSRGGLSSGDGLDRVLGQSATPGFDIQAVRRDFPALHQRVNGKQLVWLDNAATTHKPQAVIDATSRFYERDNSNIHRAAHTLAARSTDLFEAGRESVRRFLGAGDAKEIVFVRGTTEAINLVAQSFGRSQIGEGDEILLTELEHHANIVPWQIVAAQTGAVLRVIPINDRGELIVEKIPQLITSRTKIVSVAHVSNSLGTINPVREIIALAHSRGVPVLVDGAQSTPHIPINVQELDADFYVFSGHKIFAPTGIGALYGKREWLEKLPAWQGGGHMIKDVTFEKTVFNPAPEKFEAGTPDIAGVVGLGAAIDYLFRIGIPALSAYEHGLLEYATDALRSVPGLRPIGTAANKASVLSFVLPGYDNAQVARYLDEQGIAVRAGHHCAQPAIRHFGLESSVRPSLAFYNTFAEVDALVRALVQLTRR